MLVKLQHNGVHLALQTVPEELLLLYETVQDAQLIAILLTHFPLVVFPNEEEVSTNQQKNDCKYAKISFTSVQH
jgi:hypothetical protein